MTRWRWWRWLLVPGSCDLEHRTVPPIWGEQNNIVDLLTLWILETKYTTNLRVKLRLMNTYNLYDIVMACLKVKVQVFSGFPEILTKDLGHGHHSKDHHLLYPVGCPEHPELVILVWLSHDLSKGCGWVANGWPLQTPSQIWSPGSWPLG